MKYQAPKNRRTKYKFIGITTFEELWVWHEYYKKWINHDDNDYVWDGTGYTSHQPCSPIRAFRRKLKKCPKGVEFVLVSRWFNNDVIGFNTKDSKLCIPRMENITNSDEFYIAAPLYQQVLDWLREKHNISVHVLPIIKTDETKMYYSWGIMGLNIIGYTCDPPRKGENYEEQLEKGLLTALKLI